MTDKQDFIKKEDKKMEERRVSRGVIRRRVTKTEVKETKVNSTETVSESKIESPLQSNDILAKDDSSKSKIAEVEKAGSVTPASPKENTAVSKNGSKKPVRGNTDALSATKTSVPPKAKNTGGEKGRVAALHKKPIKKDEVKKGHKRFVDASREGESFVYRKHRRKFGSGKSFKQAVRAKQIIPERKASKKVIKISNGITVNNLSQTVGVKASEVIKKLMDVGIIATINHVIDIDAASLIASEYGYTVDNVGFNETIALEESVDAPETLMSRAPVVTVMGHVDHGKTSLLDAIRKTNVMSNEIGGITQRIGAYSVKVADSMITFLDTPGHEAFTQMRARGVGITDIVVLVVAADDGVMPQTIEAINHAKAADVPIIVAINKIDKPGADPDKIKSSLMEYGLVPEESGGTTLYVNVSAKLGNGVKDLLEAIMLQAEILELKANPDKPARGTVIEAKLDKGRGPAATILIQSGTLRVNDSAVCGLYYVKVRAMLDYRGNKISEAAPSTPIEIFGLEGVSSPGDNFIVLKNERDAKRISLERQLKHREAELTSNARLTLEGLYAKIKSGDVKELKLIVKADVYGSMEALIQSFKKLSNAKVKVNIIHSGASAITESDVMLARATNSIIIAFNVRPEPKALVLSENEGIEIRYYGIIYDAVKDIKDAMEGLLSPVEAERITGKAEVRDVFVVPRSGTVAGSFVIDGFIKRSSNIRLLRDSVVIHTGHINSLKRFKEDVKDVQINFECGILLENFNDIKVGDIIESYDIEYIKQTLES
ncbi:MAG TPA: translation initiation factor IF-2 [bacterium]|nr:translation initiation factor IF-2 [bacterium]